MKRAFVVALVLSVAGFSADAVAQARSRADAALLGRAFAAASGKVQKAVDAIDIHVEKTWDAPWIATSENFEIRTLAGYGYGRDLALGLEARLADFNKTLGTDYVPRTRHKVLLFPDAAAYNNYSNSNNGDEHSSFYGSFYSPQPEQAVAALFHPNPLWTRMQVTHSAVHQWLAGAYPRTTIPDWIDEGLAAYITLNWDYYYHLDQFEKLRADGRLLPLRQLLSENTAAYGDASGAHVRFVQLSMLFCYLVRFCDETRPADDGSAAPFRDYLQKVLAGESTEGTVVRELLTDPEKAAAFEREFLGYEFPR